MTVEQEWWYLDVAATRIQTWLARTPKLRHRRGASYALEVITSKADVTSSVLTPLVASDPACRWEWNDEAGEISGVVSLRRPVGPADVGDEAAAWQDARQVAHAVVVHLADRLPFCPVTVAWGRGPSYIAAHEADMRRRAEEGEVLQSPLPSVDESIVSRPCDTCGAHAVTERYKHVGREVHVCAECRERHASAGYLTADPFTRWPVAMQKIYQRLIPSDRLDGRWWFPDDFEQLAKLWDRERLNTQLATIYADGNRVGQALRALIDAATTGGCQQGGCPEAKKLAKSDLVAAIDTATKEALADSIRDRTPARDYSRAGTDYVWRPAIVHVAAGDDILVTVPADLGWSFLRLLARRFEEKVSAGLLQQAKSADVDPDHSCVRSFLDTRISIGAGMVFHHFTHPIADVIEKADREMKTAKNAGRGQCSTVSFLDLTSDGERRPTQERVWAMRDDFELWSLEGEAASLDAFSKVPPAQRSTLLQLVRESLPKVSDRTPPAGLEAPAQAPARRSNTTNLPAETAAEALARRIETMDYPAVTAVWAPRKEDEDPTLRLHRLRRFLDAARWWSEDPPVVGSPTESGEPR